MHELLNGYRRFRSERWPLERERFEQLAQGQKPNALVIACSDSRVDPSMIFGAAPGQLFIVRNVANLVPPFAPDAAYHGTSAAIEFAIRVLQVPNVVVLGHAQCGGARALLDGAPPIVSDFLPQWITIGEPARRRAMECPHVDDRPHVIEEEIVKLSLDNLKTFPWLKEAVDAGRTQLWGCRFGIRSGVLEMIGPDGKFAPVVEKLKEGESDYALAAGE